MHGCGLTSAQHAAIVQTVGSRERTRLRSYAILCLVAGLMITGCERAAEPRPAPPGGGTPPADTATATLTPGGTPEIAPAESHHFDPGTIAVGDTFMGLRVGSVEVRRVFEDSVWAGGVRFEGEIEVAGVFQPHFDHPEVNELCFHVLEQETIERIPEFAPDAWTGLNGKSWFCFTNTGDVRRLLATGEPPRHATIVVADYTSVRQFTDAWDTARLVRVVRIGEVAGRTLRQ